MQIILLINSQLSTWRFSRYIFKERVKVGKILMNVRIQNVKLKIIERRIGCVSIQVRCLLSEYRTRSLGGYNLSIPLLVLDLQHVPLTSVRPTICPCTAASAGVNACTRTFAGPSAPASASIGADVMDVTDVSPTPASASCCQHKVKREKHVG